MQKKRRDATRKRHSAETAEDLCCSVAKYRCPDYYQCEMHHSQNTKVIVKCPGLRKCPLAVGHPQNAHKKVGFIIGCGCGKCDS